jgi:RNA polymerase-binding transcription factor DksA
VTTLQTFTPSQLRELKSEMEDELAWLLRSLTEKEPISQSSATGMRGTDEWTDIAAMDREMRHRAQRRLAALLASLHRLNTGHYGECASCGRRIPYSKLAVMPEAMYCSVCSARRAGSTPEPAA